MTLTSKTSTEAVVRDFASRGMLVLDPDRLGIPADIHRRIYDKQKAVQETKQPAMGATVPEILEVLNSPGLVDICDRLLGPNWAIVPYSDGGGLSSGSRDQHWHKDDNAHSDGRKQRHHQAVQIEMLYYPQPVSEEMGPTAVIPYSHYWTSNHEENNDNFAGPDVLDFSYLLSKPHAIIPIAEYEPVSGPDSKYSFEDIVQRRTAHDLWMRDAVLNTGWPLAKQFEIAPLKRGTIVLYSHNLYHRGNHRRDPWETWPNNPRFMWRFWFYRTTDPVPAAEVPEIDWNALGVDALTGIDRSQASEDVTELWRYHHYWSLTGKTPPPRPKALQLSASEREAEAERLSAQLRVKYEQGEPLRIGAAYRLASIGDTALAVKVLGGALYDERENVRRAATYGLIAVGPEATSTFLQATTSPVKWVRKAGVYGLGDSAPLTEEVLHAVVTRLKEDPSVYVRAVAAGTLGCLGRRAIGSGEGVSLVPACVKALVSSLAREENRPCMDIAQGRITKFCRPTDDSDVFEGGGWFNPGIERFALVRSAVRENALWSLVILCSHGAHVLGDSVQPVLQILCDIIRNDQNLYSVGYAQDALARLVNLRPTQEPSMNRVGEELEIEIADVLREVPFHPPVASLVRGGFELESLYA